LAIDHSLCHVPSAFVSVIVIGGVLATPSLSWTVMLEATRDDDVLTVTSPLHPEPVSAASRSDSALAGTTH
jgi:hypothetical protein